MKSACFGRWSAIYTPDLASWFAVGREFFRYEPELEKVAQKHGLLTLRHDVITNGCDYDQHRREENRTEFITKEKLGTDVINISVGGEP
jgi:hypothetical protein